MANRRGIPESLRDRGSATGPGFSRRLDLIARQHELGELVEELVAASAQVIEAHCLPVIAQHAPFAVEKMVLGGRA